MVTYQNDAERIWEVWLYWQIENCLFVYILLPRILNMLFQHLSTLMQWQETWILSHFRTTLWTLLSATLNPNWSPSILLTSFISTHTLFSCFGFLCFVTLDQSRVLRTDYRHILSVFMFLQWFNSSCIITITRIITYMPTVKMWNVHYLLFTWFVNSQKLYGM